MKPATGRISRRLHRATDRGLRSGTRINETAAPQSFRLARRRAASGPLLPPTNSAELNNPTLKRVSSFESMTSLSVYLRQQRDAFLNSSRRCSSDPAEKVGRCGSIIVPSCWRCLYALVRELSELMAGIKRNPPAAYPRNERDLCLGCD